MPKNFDRSQASPKYQQALRVLEVLLEHGFKAMLVGGCVRDRLLGVEPKDYDIATTALPQEIQKCFSKKPYKTIPTGFDHGTITVLINSQTIEVTTLRKDIETDGRKAKVIFGQSFEEDAARRDFTINAMYADGSGKIYDFYQGKEHLQQHKLMFVGDPHARIQEDYLRILRFFRFQSRLGFQTDSKTLEAITQHRLGLKNISQERILSEIWSLLACVEVKDLFKDICETHVWNLIFEPFLGKETLKNEFQRRALVNVKKFDVELKYLAEARYAFLLLSAVSMSDCVQSWKNSILGQRLKALRISNAKAKMLYFAVNGFYELGCVELIPSSALSFVNNCEFHGGLKSFQEFYAPLWIGYLSEVTDPGRLKVLKFIIKINQKFGNRRKEKLPISGHDILKIYPEVTGDFVGKALKYLHDKYLNGEWSKKSEGIELLKNSKNKI